MNHSSVIIKSNKYGLILILDDKIPFDELLLDIAEKFKESANFFKDARMALTFRDRILTKEQEKQVVETIVNNSSIHILCIVDEQKEHEQYYQRAVEAAQTEKEEQDSLFYKGILKSGQRLEMEHSIVILGDVNPGAKVISKGNIIVLGSCMGNVYAGASGNHECFVSALILKPNLMRIADKTLRSAIVKKVDTGDYQIDPKIAYIKDDHINIKSLSLEAFTEMEF